MAENKYLSFAGLQKYDELIKALIDSKDASLLEELKAYADSLSDNYEASGSVATAKAELQALIDAVEADIEKLNGDATVDGSVDKKIADAKTELNGTISAVERKADDAQAAADAAQDYAEALELRVKANEDAIGDTDALETTAKNLADALNEVRNAVSAGGTQAAVTLSSDTTTDGMLKSYTIKQGDNVVGTIDIPKDMVVQSGEVVVLAEGEVAGHAAGTYIKLTLANATNDVIYVNVGTLVDIYKAKEQAAQVQLSIDPSTREISAVIVAESITATELAADAVTTVKIADKNVTKAKLSDAVQASLDKADVAESNAKGYADDLDEAMNLRMQGVEAALADGGSVDTDIATAKNEAIAAAAADAQTKADAAESDANKYTDEKVAAIDLSGISQNASDIDALEASLAEGGATANAIAAAEANAKSHADGLNNAMNERVEALENADDYTEITTEEINGLFK